MRAWTWIALAGLLACDGGGDDTGDDTSDDTGDTADTSDDSDDDTSDSDTGGGDTSDSDTDDTDTDDSGVDTSNPLPTRFSNNNPLCGSFGGLRPGSTEDGQWGGVRLTPPSYPFELTHVEMTVVHNPDSTTIKCVGNQAYTMKMFIVTGTAPPNGPPPAVADEWTFGTGSLLGDRVLNGDVIPSIVLTTGQHVILALDTHYVSDDDRTCIKTCATGTLADPPRNYWSNAADPASWAWTTYTPTGTGIWAEAEGYPQ